MTTTYTTTNNNYSNHGVQTTSNIPGCNTTLLDSGYGNVWHISIGDNGNIETVQVTGSNVKFVGAFRPLLGFSWSSPKNFRAFDIDTHTLSASADVSGSDSGFYFDNGTDVIANIDSGNMLSVKFDGSAPVSLGGNPSNLRSGNLMIQKDNLSVIWCQQGSSDQGYVAVFDKNTLGLVSSYALPGNSKVVGIYHNNDYVAIIDDRTSEWPRKFSKLDLYSYDGNLIPVDTTGLITRGFDSNIVRSIKVMGKYYLVQRNNSDANNVDIFELKL
jgi:hypothetical protein